MFAEKLAILLVVVLTLSGCSTSTKTNIVPNSPSPKQDATNVSKVSPAASTTGDIETSSQTTPFIPTILIDIANFSKKTIAWSWMYSP